jgi:trans-aconitate methyltransferase
MKHEFLAGVLAYAGIMTLNHYTKKRQAFAYAKTLVKDWGIVNLGAIGDSQFDKQFPQQVINDVDVACNVDISEEFVTQKPILRFDLNDLHWPIPDKRFDVVFASHILEHLRNTEQVLNEMQRIGHNVVIVLPHPFSVTALVNPLHLHHFSYRAISKMRQRGVVVYA